MLLYKEPGKDWMFRDTDMSLKSLQDMVGGYLEPVHVGTKFCVLCDEEGILKRLKPNTSVQGISFVEPIVVVGVNRRTGDFKRLDKKDIVEFNRLTGLNLSM